jgi:muconolactone D-isomerase
MDFLVNIKVMWPPAGDEVRKAELIAAERARAKQLADEGILIRMWRIPGAWANVGIWRADTATELHDAISSLPFYPWLDVTVVALADHPSDPGDRARG